MGYRTLFIRESEKLNLYLDNIVVHTKEGELRFLLSDLKILVIDNYKLTLSVQLINKLNENNVSIIICDMSHMPHCQLLPLNGYYASSGTMQKQLEWDEQTKLLVHKEIVKGKIQSQIDILFKNNKNESVISRIKEFKEEVEPGDVTNREGLAAKMYFRELFGVDFIRFDEDVINAGMNYGYAVLRSLISSMIVSKGLLPNIGIFHKGKTNSFNLSDDIIEVYRPLVDDWVYNNLMNKELLGKEDRINLVGLVDRKILMNNQLFTINHTVEMYIESIIKCFDNKNINNIMIPSLKEIHDL